MASKNNAMNAVDESMRSLKLDTKSKGNNGHMPGRKTSEATSSISSADAGSILRENKVDWVSSVPDQGIYYPANEFYGYYYPGFGGLVGEWDNQSFYMLADGFQIQQPANQIDNGSLVYYSPGFQPGYDPQTQYMPGALIGTDGQYWGQQLYYPDPMVSQPLASPASFPQTFAYGSELYSAYSWDPYTTYADGIYDKGYGDVAASAPKSNSSCMAQTPANSKTAPSSRSTTSEKKGPSTALDATLNHTSQIQSLKPTSKANTILPRGFLPMNKLHSYSNQGKHGYLYPDNTSNIKGTEQSWFGAEKLKLTKRAPGAVELDMLNEQNRGPRTNGSKNTIISGPESVVSLGAEGNNCSTSVTVINKDDYNLPEFPTKYDNAFFFVIKSYSEDDIHKSIKYNVWASTTNGNKRLDAAFQAAQEKTMEKGCRCPVFLFFSVNASGQFCGVAEMIGRVDFDKSMDFWQQDKWNGCFPVKWHIVKDIPNPHLRHIILENNDNKPVTNSRDTQEVKLPQGIEMLNLFKNYSSKTSILDDFEFYEDRQKVMQEKKMKSSSPKLDPLTLKANDMAEDTKQGDPKSAPAAPQLGDIAAVQLNEEASVEIAEKE